MRTQTRIKIKPLRKRIKFDFSFTSKSPYPRDIPLAKKTLEIAKQNLQASRRLFSQGYIPEAVFFLQQSVEKGCKAFGYYYGFIDEDLGIKKIGHHSTKVYSRSLFEYEKIITEAKKQDEQSRALRFINRLNIPFISRIDDKIQVALEIHKAVDTPQSPINIEEKLVELTKNVIDFSDEMNREIKQFGTDDYTCKVVDKFNQELDQREIDFLSKSRWLYRHNYKIKFRIKEIFNNFRKSTQKEIVNCYEYLFYRLYSSKCLILLGRITQPHESSTRYASTKLTFNPLEYYSQKVCVVNNFTSLTGICQDNLEALNHIFSYEEIQRGVS
jgi:HEPN domain-containing protein